MNCACQRYDGMPSIQPMAKFATGERGPIEIIVPHLDGRVRFPERQDGRESLGGPEYRLSVESFFRISREKTAPIYCGIDVSFRSIAQRLSDF